MRGLAPARVRQARGGGDAHWLVSPVPGAGNGQHAEPRAGRRRAVPVADDGPRQFAHRGRGRGFEWRGRRRRFRRKATADERSRFIVSGDSRRLVRNLTTMTSPSCHTSARTGGAPRPRESLAAMEELQKVRCRARRARSSGSRSATPPVPGRSSRAFALTRRARLPSRDSRRADPPACPLPRRRSASAWSRCARWASASSKRFVKRASSLPRRGRNGRVLSADAKAGDGHPSPSSRSSIFASRRLATDVVPQIS